MPSVSKGTEFNSDPCKANGRLREHDHQGCEFDSPPLWHLGRNTISIGATNQTCAATAILHRANLLPEGGSPASFCTRKNLSSRTHRDRWTV